MAKQSSTEKLPLRKTLLWKLGWIFLITSCIGAAFHLNGFLWRHRRFLHQVEQSLHWDIAEEFAIDLRPLTSPRVDWPAVERKIHDFRRHNRGIDVYLLDQNGRVLYSSYYMSHREQVPLEPLEKFLTTEGFPPEPIFGASPWDTIRAVHGEKDLFSTARIQIEDAPGYVYVILHGHRYQVVYHAIGDLSLSVASGAFLLFFAVLTTLFGLLLSYFVTKRFRSLTEAIQCFSRGDYSTRAKTAGDDEVGLHADAFNEMAATIEDNIRMLKESDQLRRQLIANVSHDLRTPLAAMQSLLETLHDKSPSMDQENRTLYVERALVNCQDLATLVDDLFELSKLDAKTEGAELVPLELKPFLLSIVKKLLAQAEKKELALVLDVPKDLPRVSADQKMLNRAVSNLIENAIRYSESGGEIRLAANQDEGGKVMVSVSDQGIGISEEELPEVFERFFRGSRAAKKERSGSGLGLAITRRIIELHGEEITVSSVFGQGSVFTFALKTAAD